MLISNLEQDPIEFAVSKENELKNSLKEWNNKSLKLLLSSSDLVVSGNKETLVKNVIDGIKFGQIDLITLQKWFKKYLREGKRHVFIFDIIPEHANALRDIEKFEALISEKSLGKVDTLFQNVDDGLVLFNYSTTDNNIAQVTLAYKEKKILRIPNFNTETIDKKTIDYYIFIDINLDDHTMAINLEPTTGLIEDEESDATVSVKQIALRFKKEMEENFGLEFYNSNEITPKALYKIWKDATKHELPELTGVLDSITEEVDSFVENISKSEILDLDHETQLKLTTKILSNLETSILTARYDQYKEEIENARKGKSGYITEQRIRERSGSTLNQKSRDKLTPIEHSDTFSDTRVTIDELERVQKLYYTWKGLDDIPPGTIPTIIESLIQYDLVIFTSHTTTEEMRHVLDQLKRTKSSIRIPRSFGQ